MMDGLDRSAIKAELANLPPTDRRCVSQDLKQWMREAGRAAGPVSNLGIFVVGIAVAIGGFSFELRPHVHPLLALAAVILMVGAGMNIYSARRARAWRRTHPFAQWRSQGVEAR